MILPIAIGAILLVAGLLLYLLIGPLDKTEPKIVVMKEPIRMIGVSMRTGMKTIYQDAAKLGKLYRKVKEQNLIRDKKAPWGFVAISKDFQGIESWDYLIGDVVNKLDSIPQGLQGFEIPALTCAVFPIRPKSKFAWGITIGRMKKYIFTEWLPKTGYESDSTIVGDFEYHDARSTGKKPEIDLYVPIKQRQPGAIVT